MAITVRVARVSDAGDIARLAMQFGYESGTPVVAERLARILLRPDQHFFIAEFDGCLAGRLHAIGSEYVEFEPFVVISGLVVDKSHRRQGIGTQLMQHAEDWARSQGCSVVRLLSSAGRTAVHDFYQRLGYTKIKTQYSFIKSLDADRGEALNKFIPRLDQ
jgi:GNAT superfamily N-acetyltransferase